MSFDREGLEALADHAAGLGVAQVVAPYAPVGPTADALAQAAQALQAEGLRLIQVRRGWDSRFWPHATAGFFAFRKQIPALLDPERAR